MKDLVLFPDRLLFPHYQFEWVSSNYFQGLRFDGGLSKVRLSAGVYDAIQDQVVKRKVFRKDPFIFYERDPHSKNPLKQVLLVNMPLCRIRKNPGYQSDSDYRHVLELSKGNRKTKIYINRPEIWRKEFAKDFIWTHSFSEEFSILRPLPSQSKEGICLFLNRETESQSQGRIYDLSNFASSDCYKNSVETSITLLRRLDHPNILSFQCCFLTRNKLVVLQDYNPGSLPLSSLKTVDCQKRRSLMRGLYQALLYLADKGIRMDKLSSSDLLVSSDNKIYFSDFMAAKSSGKRIKPLKKTMKNGELIDSAKTDLYKAALIHRKMIESEESRGGDSNQKKLEEEEEFITKVMKESGQDHLSDGDLIWLDFLTNNHSSPKIRSIPMFNTSPSMKSRSRMTSKLDISPRKTELKNHRNLQNSNTTLKSPLLSLY